MRHRARHYLHCTGEETEDLWGSMTHTDTQEHSGGEAEGWDEPHALVTA